MRALLLSLLLSFSASHASAQDIALLAPGAPLLHPADGWHALSLKDGALALQPVSTTRAADWRSASGKQADRLHQGGKPRATAPARTLALPAGSLFAVRLADTPGLRPEPMPSVVPATVLNGRWQASALIGNKRWLLSAQGELRPDGQLLDGSLALLGKTEGSAAQVLLPGASGMAFVRQELLWAGDLDRNGRPDLLLRRTRFTGTVEYVLVLAPLFQVLAIESPDPVRYYSSGVEPDSNELHWHTSRPLRSPFTFQPEGKLVIGFEEWQRLLPAGLPLPKTIAERSYVLKGETLRITLDYLPRAEKEPSSASETLRYSQVLVRVHYRGATQVLMEAGAPDDGQFALSVGLVDGKAAIRIDYQPHYNNQYEHGFLHDGTTFRAAYVNHSQGC